uniref:Si:dkeyp-97a10.2 n=1 Tax=Oryzias latipes TaxID=8090 RepID=A0A3P9H3X8_ORYLA
MIRSLSTVPCGLLSMSVHIINEEPVHVIPGSSLVLKARIDQGPLEAVSMVTWERKPETGSHPVRVTLATCPGRSPHVEQQETTLEINGYSRADSGVYAVTVTDHTGANITAYCIVREYGTDINVSHSVLVCGEAWGTEPHFSWLYERAAISQTLGRVSKDGTTLFVMKSPICGHFTCTVSNKLGYSSATYTAGTGCCFSVCLLCMYVGFGIGLFQAIQNNRRRHKKE